MQAQEPPEDLIEYRDILASTLRIQNRLVELHQQRLKIYNEYFFEKRLLRAEWKVWKVFKSSASKQQIQQKIRSINQREQAIVDIIIHNDPRKKLNNQEAQIPERILKNLLTYYDTLMKVQLKFLQVEDQWVHGDAEKKDLLISYTELMKKAREYETLNRQEIRSHGKYLRALKGLLDAKDNDPKNFAGYPLYILPFVALFDPFMDAYYKWAHGVEFTPIPNMDNLVILLVAVFLVYMDLPTRVGDTYAGVYEKAVTYCKKQGWTY